MNAAKAAASTRPIWLIPLLFILVSTDVAAQLRGRVVDTNGGRIHGAQVDLWSADERLAVSWTDSTGVFTFSPDVVATATRTHVSRIGFRSSWAEFDPAADTLFVVRLEVEPVQLAPVAAAPEDAVCPQSEDNAARRIWSAAAGRYSPHTWARGASVEYLFRESRLIPATAVGTLDDRELEERSMRYVGARSVPTIGRYYDINRRFKEEGYARATGHDHPYWKYPALEGRHAHHFASRAFGDAHVLALMRADADGYRIAFCPVSTGKPAIHGVLLISPDTAFVSARWRYTLPRQSEIAGGQVTFVPRDDDDLVAEQHLLPMTGSLWYQHWASEDRFVQRWSVFLAWRIGASDEAPDWTSGAHDAR